MASNCVLLHVVNLFIINIIAKISMHNMYNDSFLCFNNVYTKPTTFKNWYVQWGNLQHRGSNALCKYFFVFCTEFIKKNSSDVV